jgi:hypothetical protein
LASRISSIPYSFYGQDLFLGFNHGPAFLAVFIGRRSLPISELISELVPISVTGDLELAWLQLYLAVSLGASLGPTSK